MTDNITLNRYPTRDVKLRRSGVVVTVPADWHVSDTMAAQRHGKGDAMAMQLALIHRVCLFDGARLPIGDIETRISGKDWMQLMGEVFGDDDGEDGDGRGND